MNQSNMKKKAEDLRSKILEILIRFKKKNPYCVARVHAPSAACRVVHPPPRGCISQWPICRHECLAKQLYTSTTQCFT